MRVIVTLVDLGKETRIEGASPIFGNAIDYKRGVDSRLRDIGFWLSDWCYCEPYAKPHRKSRIFVPWGSALLIEEVTSND